MPGLDAEGFKKVDLLKLHDSSLLEEIKEVCIDYHEKNKPSITLNQLYADVIYRLQHKQATRYLSYKSILEQILDGENVKRGDFRHYMEV